LSVYCVFFVVAVYFITDCILSYWILTSCNNWVRYRISSNVKAKTVLIVEFCKAACWLPTRVQCPKY